MPAWLTWLVMRLKYGVHTVPVSVNLAEVLQRKRDLVDSLPNFPGGMIDMTP